MSSELHLRAPFVVDMRQASGSGLQNAVILKTAHQTELLKCGYIQDYGGSGYDAVLQFLILKSSTCTAYWFGVSLSC